jgi:hypothetical protein
MERPVQRPAPLELARLNAGDVERLHRPADSCINRHSSEQGCRLARAGINVDASHCNKLGYKDPFERGVTPETVASSGDLPEGILPSPRDVLWSPRDAEEDDIISPQAEYRMSVSTWEKWQNPSETFIIFDWDDTLFPTTYIWADENMHWDKPADAAALASLERQMCVVEHILREATKFGRVCILTLAKEPWVSTSIKNFMPGLEGLFKELEVEVIYARAAMSETAIRGIVEDGVRDVGQALKSAAMENLLSSFYTKDGHRVSWKNVISIGDSLAEYYSIQDVTFRHKQKDPHGEVNECRCKAVKLQEKPELDTLTAELEVLANWLSQIVAHDGDLDLDFEDLEDGDSFITESPAASFGVGA